MENETTTNWFDNRQRARDYGARVVVSPDAESVKSIDVSPAMDEDRDNGQEGSPSNEPGWMSRWDKWNKR